MNWNKSVVSFFFIFNIYHLLLWGSKPFLTVELLPRSWCYRGPSGCRNLKTGPGPTVPNDCIHKKGFNSLSRLSPHTLVCRRERKKKNSRGSLKQPQPSFTTLYPDLPPHCIQPPSPPAPTSLLTPAACIKDPSEVSLATFTSERGPIMERLERRMSGQRGTHRCGGGWGGGDGGRKAQRPIVTKHPPPNGGEEEDRAESEWGGHGGFLHPNTDRRDQRRNEEEEKSEEEEELSQLLLCKST